PTVYDIVPIKTLGDAKTDTSDGTFTVDLPAGDYWIELTAIHGDYPFHPREDFNIPARGELPKVELRARERANFDVVAVGDADKPHAPLEGHVQAELAKKSDNQTQPPDAADKTAGSGDLREAARLRAAYEVQQIHWKALDNTGQSMLDQLSSDFL